MGTRNALTQFAMIVFVELDGLILLIALQEQMTGKYVTFFLLDKKWNAFENVAFKMAAILFRRQCVDTFCKQEFEINIPREICYYHYHDMYHQSMKKRIG